MAFSLNGYDYIVGIDPGIHGGISILDKDGITVHPMPIIKKQVGTKKKPKVKNEIDEDGIVFLFSKLAGNKVRFGLEFVHSMPGEGSVSSFNFGAGWGYIKGVAKAFGFELDIVSPVTWKKKYAELENKLISDLREQSKALKEEIKSIKKSEKALIKEKKKELDKIGRNIKSEAKRLARELAAKMAPNLQDEFKLVNSDGKAESVLIGFYILEKTNELVQESKKD